MRRRLAQVGREILELASQDSGELEAILDEAERRVFQLAERKREGELRPVRELMERTLDLLDRMKMSSSGVTGLSTGFIDLDLQLTGLHPGELLILAARPGVGKDVAGDEHGDARRPSRGASRWASSPWRCRPISS